jgi:Domain of unknown function (DUF4345)
MSLGLLLIRLNAAFFVVYGLAFVFFPETLGRAITGSAPDTSSGVIDMRATYGGMTVAVGLALAWLGRSESKEAFGLYSIALVMLCMASSRLVGIVCDGDANSIMYAYLAAEVVVLVLALWAARSHSWGRCASHRGERKA